MIQFTIRRRLVLAAAFIYLASVVFIVTFTYHRYDARMKENARSIADKHLRLFKNLTADHGDELTMFLIGLKRDVPVLSAFAEKDRNELLRVVAPLFDELKTIRSLTHMYFIELDGTVLLRVHRPEQYGDRLRRVTFERAARTGKPAVGLELGRNFFGIRSVAPMFVAGRHLGYIEIAEDARQVFRQMKEITGDDVALLLPEDYINRHDSSLTGERVGATRLVYPTGGEAAADLARKTLANSPWPPVAPVASLVEREGSHHAVGISELRDPSGAPTGFLFTHTDVSRARDAMWKGILASSAAFSGIFLISGIALYLSLRRSVNLFERLREHIRGVADSGSLEGKLPASTGDEVGELVCEFNLMKEEIGKLKLHLEKRAEELQETNRDLEAFTYSVSHDLRLPLNRIYMAAELLNHEADGCREDLRTLSRSVCDGVEDMDRLIQALLHMSKAARQSMKFEKVDLSRVAMGVAGELQMAGGTRSVDLTIREELWAWGDEQLLTSAVRNLMGNAWKYTQHVPAPEVEFGAVEGHAHPCFFVRDNGAGFPMSKAALLFEPFRRLHDAEEFPGTGIGLASTSRIIKRHGGEIWAESAPGKGATFYFTLPHPDPSCMEETPAGDAM